MTLQFYLLPYLEKFHEKYPRIKVTVTNAPTPETLEFLYDGKIDFGVVSEPFWSRPEIDQVKVREIQDVFIAGGRFLHLKGKIMDYKALEGLPIICLEHNTSTRKYIDDFLKENDVVLTPEFELAMSDIIVKFAQRNLGVGCVVRDFAKEALEGDQLFELTFKEAIPKRHFCIITSHQNPISKAAKELLDMLGME
jgi:DNA-binding transcriptional LysR family regulator